MRMVRNLLSILAGWGKFGEWEPEFCVCWKGGGGEWGAGVVCVFEGADLEESLVEALFPGKAGSCGRGHIVVWNS